ncbi:hypothetical protein [Pseudazoarcus pumilus]|uniref:Uncharacterized protein n=1 Tax=Pseudazoarcus pumilus TaxID=2067960 RepID=A0A2I6S7F9_9RHOO|nr:hypothetical protein [Pseudazoarcus pumilus]AUN95193.1 hypothetical protein C0099_09785 [Pseudazoarcus pumilus]
MYEIWLGLNIFFEIALTALPLPLLIGYGVVLVGLFVLALVFARGAFRRALMPAVVLGVIVLVIGFFLLPGLTRSSLGEMGYWVDWATLIGLAAACGGLVAALAWPAIALMRRS